MNIQTALLPHKHVRFSESLLGIAGHIRDRLVEPRTVDELWAIIETDASAWPTRPTFTQVVLSLYVLFAIGEIEAASDGRVNVVRI